MTPDADLHPRQPPFQKHHQQPAQDQQHEKPPNNIQLHPNGSTVARPTVDAATARIRRGLAVSRAARAGISNLVDAIKIAKPPRAPPKTPGGIPTASRRHALIPLAEGRDQLEARIRTLEDGVATRDESLVQLKRQIGRGMMKRRHVERERDTAIAQLKSMACTARMQHEAAISARGDLQNLVDNMATLLTSAYELSTNNVQMTMILDDMTASSDTAKAKLSIDLPSCPTIDEVLPVSIPQNHHPHSTYSHSTRPRTTSSVVFSDDDARSCGSYASSALGDSREAQLDSLVELVEILDARLSTGPPHLAASNALQRARRTIANVQRDHDDPSAPAAPASLSTRAPALASLPSGAASNSTSISARRPPAMRSNVADTRSDLDCGDVERRQDIARIVDAIIKERLGNKGNKGSAHSTKLHRGSINTNGVVDHEDVEEDGEDTIAELARTAVAHVELHEAREAAEALRKRVASLEKLAERAVRVDELTRQNADLNRSLETAKSTVRRLVREQGAAGVGRRLPGVASAGVTPGSTPRLPRALKTPIGVGAGDQDDVLRRVLVWQQDASTASESTRGQTRNQPRDRKVKNNEGSNNDGENDLTASSAADPRASMSGSLANGQNDNDNDDGDDDDDIETNESTVELPSDVHARLPDRVDEVSPNATIGVTSRAPSRPLTRRPRTTAATNTTSDDFHIRHDDTERSVSPDKDDGDDDDGDGDDGEQGQGHANQSNSTMGEFGRSVGDDVAFSERSVDGLGGANGGNEDVASNHSFGGPTRGFLRRQNSNASCLSGMLSDDAGPNVFWQRYETQVDGLRGLLSDN